MNEEPAIIGEETIFEWLFGALTVVGVITVCIVALAYVT